MNTLPMNCPRPVVCLTPLPANVLARNPSVLLIGQQQTALLRCLDGWPRRRGKSSAFFAQFCEPSASLAHFPDDRFDLAVAQSPAAGQADELIHQLTRIARQGLLTRQVPALGVCAVEPLAG